jgi:hypothetical protein
MIGATASARQITRSDLAAAMSRADLARERSEAALRLARQLIETSHELRSEAGAGATVWPRYFVVHGSLDGSRVRASWFRGSLQATSLLRSRAELLVAMGESFRVDNEHGPVVVAALDDSLAAMLTIVRACDRIDAVSLGPLVGLRRVRSSRDP